MTVLWVVLAILWVAMFFWLGLATLRNGHGWLFFFGIFFPLLWIFGALSGPRSDLVEPAPPGGGPGA